MESISALPDARLQRLVLENVSDIIVTTDLQFIVQSWNHIAERFYDIPAEEAIGRSMSDLVPFGFSNTNAKEALAQLLAHKIWQGEVSFTSATGETFYFLQTVKYVTDEAGAEVGIMAVGRNVTEQKHAAEQLAQSEKFYRTLIADSLDVVLLLNAEGLITFASPAVHLLLGYAAEETIGTNGFGYIHPDDLGWAIQSFEKEIVEKPEIKFIIIRLRKKSGDWVWCMVRGHNLLNVPPIGAIAVYIHDDTPRKRASDALKESEKRFRNLIRDLQVGVVLMNGEGAVTLTNQTAARIFETTEENVAGRKMHEVCDDAIHEDGTPFLLSQRPTFRALQTRQLVKDVVMGIWSKAKKERIWLLISTDPLEDAQGRVQSVISTFTDITERKKQEKKAVAEKTADQRRLAQATIDGQERERLEIGRELHDSIGQQLTSIKLFLDMAKNAAEGEAPGFVEMALKNVSAVIDEVRLMSRSLVPPTLKDLGLIDSVNELIEGLRSAQSVNFILNGCDFEEAGLPENKKLALFRIVQEQLNNVVKHSTAKNAVITLRNAGNQILLQITDDGAGFDFGKIRRGLGLTNIINRSELFGGRVEISAPPGKGCTLNVWLPHPAVRFSE